MELTAFSFTMSFIKSVVNIRPKTLIAVGAALCSFFPAGCVRTSFGAKVDPSKANVATASGGSKQPGPPSLTDLELSLHKRINAQRTSRGLKPLRQNDELRRVARYYSRQMSEKGFFSHTDPEGKTMVDRVRAADITYSMLAENLASNVNAKDPLGMAETGWMKSKGHRNNILHPDLTESGIGIWRVGRSYHFTQLFLRPRE